MAKPPTATTTETTTAPAKAKRAPIDKDVRKRANLLKEISACYREAADALTKGDNTSMQSALNLADRYGELYTELSKKIADNATAEGLAEAQEM